MQFESALEDLTSKGALDHFGSLDSSDTFHSFSSGAAPFPSQGSLARLEEMAAHGSMFTVDKKPAESRCRKPGRAAGRSVSTDMELDKWDTGLQDLTPKHKRTRISQGSSFNKSRDVDSSEGPSEAHNNHTESKKKASKGGLAAVINQGLASLGEKFGSRSGSVYNSNSSLMGGSSPKSSEAASCSSASDRKKSILKKSDILSSSGRGNSRDDPEMENLLLASDSDCSTSLSATPVPVRRLIHNKVGTLAAAAAATNEDPPPSRRNHNKEIQTSSLNLLPPPPTGASVGRKFTRARDPLLILSSSSSVPKDLSASLKCVNRACPHNIQSNGASRPLCKCGNPMEGGKSLNSHS
eukprot:TRINITY_DN1960_c0_g1_i7.p1 TRINITY_DN1960_c0_g1~~TRINITY_DN1960_c0_g1_i7.p1  ORF type:complete len:353 (+),score=119.91 TRINITY_DN1960_c0_g1_i7:1227-2285(+)